jgi:hypothetical protein
MICAKISPSIDILASRLVFGNLNNESSPNSRRGPFTGSSQHHKNSNAALGFSAISMYPVGNVETRVDSNGIASASQEQIIDRAASRFDSRSTDGDEESQHKGTGGTIVKTVEFEFHDSSAR